MVILLQLNDSDIPPHECAEWPELRWSGGSCYGLSVMQINVGSGPFCLISNESTNKFPSAAGGNLTAEHRGRGQQSQPRLPWQHRQQN